MNARFTSFVVKVRTFMALRKVLICHKSEGMLLASTDDDKLQLTDMGKQAPTWSKALWEFTQDGLVINQFHGLHLHVEPNSQNVVLGKYGTKRVSNWIPTPTGKIHLASDKEICLCVFKSHEIQVRFYPASHETTEENFNWVILSDEGEPVTIPRDQVDFLKPQHGFLVARPQQNPSSATLTKDLFFVHDDQWHALSTSGEFDFIVVGSSFCGFSFVQRILKNNSFAKILILERGDYFLTQHFQNLPLQFQNTLGGVSETFPWSITPTMHNGEYIKWLHGQVSCLGGKSIMWSGWCPEPPNDKMPGWPKEIMDTIHSYFEDATKLLNITSAKEINTKENCRAIATNQPGFGVLQNGIEKSLQDNQSKLTTVNRIMPAPLAVNAPLSW